MSLTWNRSLKTSLATVGLATAAAIAIPATASADIVDDALARIPAGEISCEQANQYWTTEAEYNSYANQARAAAFFHPRGGEINDALVRIDAAAERCGLKGGGGNTGGQGNNPAPSNPAPANPAPGGNNQQAGAPTGPVFTVPVPAGTPTTTMPIADIASVIIPDFQAIMDDALAQLPAGSSF